MISETDRTLGQRRRDSRVRRDDHNAIAVPSVLLTGSVQRAVEREQFLDDCRVPETGTLTDDAAGIVTQLASYTEVSPSGTGVHVLVKGTLPGDRNRSGWIECYDDARFFTVTGEHVDGTPTTIESRTRELGAVYTEYVKPDEPSKNEPDKSTTAATSDSASDDDDGQPGTNSKGDTDTGRSAATRDADELQAEVVALRQTVEGLTVREEHHIDTRAQLRTQVEHLQAANERLHGA